MAAAAGTLVVAGRERGAAEGSAEMPLERLEAEICELAGHLAAGECRWLLLLSEFDRWEGWATAQLEEIVRAYRFVTGREEERHHNDRHEERFARWRWDDDGSLVISARLGPEDGAVFLAALEAGRELAAPAPSAGVGGRSDSAESPMAEAASADALVAMAKLALAAPDGTEPGPAETLLEGADGNPLDVGRSRRTPPARLRQALRRREGGCRFPACGARRFLHAHHIRHWIHGGATKLSNLILICGRHHRLLHEGGFRIEVLAENVFAFFDANGRRLPEVAVRAPPSGPPIEERNREHGGSIDAETCRPLGGGEPYDLGLAVEALLTAPGRATAPTAA